MPRVGILVVSVLALFAAPMPAEARDWALLIAAGKYDDTQIHSLTGPVNDAAGMFAALRMRGVPAEDMVVLADGPSTVTALNSQDLKTATRERATRLAILAALAELAQKAVSGDSVVIYYSGHGVQVPDTGEPDGGKEPDGLDEAIAPVDVKLSGETVGGVITDDEFGVAIAKIRAKGAFVWVILDSCHSGTALRGGESDAPSATAVSRRLTRARVAAGPREAFNDSMEQPDDGFSALYAVHPDEEAYEDVFADDGAKEVWGAMTHAILPLLRSNQPVTVRTLAAAARAGYDWREPRTPYIEGAIDRPFLKGGARRIYLARSDNDGWRLDGGALDGISADWRFNLADPATPQTVLAEARVRSVTAIDAVIDVTLMPGRTLPKLVSAEATQRPGLATLRVKIDNDATLRALASRPMGDGAPIQFVTSAPYDAALIVEGQQVFISKTAVRDHGYAPALSMTSLAKPDGAKLLAQALRTYGAALSLTRALQEFETQVKAAPLEIHIAVKRAEARPALTHLCTTAEDGTDWKSALEKAWSVATPLDSEVEPLRLSHCDLMLIRLTNHGQKPVDVTTLYIETSGAITPLIVDPGGNAGHSARLMPGQTTTLGVYEDFASDNTASLRYPAVIGGKQISLIMAEAINPAASVTFDYLAQSRLEAPPGQQVAPGALRDDRLATFDRVVRSTMAIQPDGPLRGVVVAVDPPRGQAQVVTVRFQSYTP